MCQLYTEVPTKRHMAQRPKFCAQLGHPWRSDHKMCIWTELLLNLNQKASPYMAIIQVIYARKILMIWIWKNKLHKYKIKQFFRMSWTTWKPWVWINVRWSAALNHALKLSVKSWILSDRTLCVDAAVLVRVEKRHRAAGVTKKILYLARVLTGFLSSEFACFCRWALILHIWWRQIIATS